MPIYEYWAFNKFERIIALPLIACPTCGGKASFIKKSDILLSLTPPV